MSNEHPATVSPQAVPLNQSAHQVRVLQNSNVQAKSAKVGAKNAGINKSKERKNRVAQQPYIAQSKVPQAYL